MKMITARVGFGFAFKFMETCNFKRFSRIYVVICERTHFGWFCIIRDTVSTYYVLQAFKTYLVLILFIRKKKLSTLFNQVGLATLTSYSALTLTHTHATILRSRYFRCHKNFAFWFLVVFIRIHSVRARVCVCFCSKCKYHLKPVVGLRFCYWSKMWYLWLYCGWYFCSFSFTFLNRPASFERNMRHCS